MSDLIKREDAIAIIDRDYGDEHYTPAIIGSIEELPSADRPQGEWIGYEVPSECSVCGHCWDEYVLGQDIWYDGSVPNYCPNCGCRMKGANNE